ncbi:MAG TPA: DUF4384 domain-containing protein [Polyangia bacterium]|jgi:hypothetical protein|nr:DUF4384 domain-containing protein [Polyangia bacterium]
MVDFTRTRPETCLSDRALDMMMAGELAPDARATAEQHLPGCAACTARLRELEAARAAFPLEAPAFAKLAATVAPARARRRWWAWGGGFATLAAAAAAVVLLVRATPGGDGFGIKGGERIGFFVSHDGAVRAGAPGEVVHPGDRLQVVYTTRAPRTLAIFSRDAKGATTVAFPRDLAAGVRIEAGTDTPLPYSLQLDDAAGVETLHGLFCDRPLPLEPLRRSLEEGGERTKWPAGCHVDRISYVKQR